jgi:hypothetical protein
VGYTDLTLDAGTDFSSNIDLLADDGTAINVTGFTFESQVRKSYYSINATANIIVTTVDGTNGNLVLSLDSANTANIKPGIYVYDVLMTTDQNVKSRLVEGKLIVTPRVSQ